MHVHKITIIILLVLFFCSNNTIKAQQLSLSPIILQTSRGLVGERTDIVLLARADSISFNGNVLLNGVLMLSNPTVFYPEGFLASQGTQLITPVLKRLNDSMYSFSLSLRCTQAMHCDTLVRLRGEVLAASDSVTGLRLVNMQLTDGRGSRMIPATSATLTIGSIGTPLPIIRRPRLEQSAPNPVLRGNSATWAYRIDEPSDITFVIYTVLGQEVARLERKNQSRGAHWETWTPTTPLSAGVYYVRFASSSGDIWQRCIIQ